MGVIILLPRVFRIQVRYGNHWAPVHPDKPIQGILTEMLLASGEYLTHLRADTGDIIDVVQFTSNLQTFPEVGLSGRNLNVYVPLKGLLYFSGGTKQYVGERVSGLMAHRDTCENS